MKLPDLPNGLEPTYIVEDEELIKLIVIKKDYIVIFAYDGRETYTGLKTYLRRDDLMMKE